MKKYILGFVAMGALVFFGGNALAEGWVNNGDLTSNVTVSNDNHAYVNTEAGSIANTGGNSADATSGSLSGSSRAKGGMIMTGAATADTAVIVGVNDTQTTIDQSGNGDVRDGDVILNTNVSNHNDAKIKTKAFSAANTGMNTTNALSGSLGGSSRAKGGMIQTGVATATTAVGVIANTNWTSILH